jgi:hypothetical protein
MKWLRAYSITLSRIFPLFLLSLLSRAFAQPALTIYSGHFAVVRDTVPLDLKAGLNQIRYAEVTSNLEPTSVILRDPSGKLPLSILEQSYQNEPLTEPPLL